MYSSRLMINQCSEFWFFCKPCLSLELCCLLKPYPGVRYFEIRLLCYVRDRFSKTVRINKIFLTDLNKTYNCNFLLLNCSGQVSVCLKPAPRNSMGCKFYGGFFFSCRKFWSVVCWLVDHYIGYFISF